MGWWRRRWGDGRTDRLRMQGVRQRVEGWWSSMTWSHDPERRKKVRNQKREART